MTVFASVALTNFFRGVVITIIVAANVRRGTKGGEESGEIPLGWGLGEDFGGVGGVGGSGANQVEVEGLD